MNRLVNINRTTFWVTLTSSLTTIKFPQIKQPTNWQTDPCPPKHFPFFIVIGPRAVDTFSMLISDWDRWSSSCIRLDPTTGSPTTISNTEYRVATLQIPPIPPISRPIWAITFRLNSPNKTRSNQFGLHYISCEISHFTQNDINHL